MAKVVDFIAMQMSRVNCEKGYSRTPENDIILNLTITCALTIQHEKRFASKKEMQVNVGSSTVPF